jgi:hypothetical protein
VDTWYGGLVAVCVHLCSMPLPAGLKGLMMKEDENRFYEGLPVGWWAVIYMRCTWMFFFGWVTFAFQLSRVLIVVSQCYGSSRCIWRRGVVDSLVFPYIWDVVDSS